MLYPYPYPYPHPGIFKRAYPYSGYSLRYGRTELTKVGYGYECRTFRTYKSSGTGNTRKNTAGMIHSVRTLQKTRLTFLVSSFCLFLPFIFFEIFHERSISVFVSQRTFGQAVISRCTAHLAQPHLLMLRMGVQKSKYHSHATVVVVPHSSPATAVLCCPARDDLDSLGINNKMLKQNGKKKPRKF